MSSETESSGQRNARPFMSRGIAIYFGILIVLTLIALVPGAVTIGLYLFILPGLILTASPTLLYYSLAVLPAYFINRIFRKRRLAAAVAVVSLAAAAVLPHAIDEYLLSRLIAADHSDPPTSFRPRSFELPYPELENYWMNRRRPESRDSIPPPPCADLCQQLLFRGNVDQVVIRDTTESDPLAKGTLVITRSRVYRIDPDGTMQEIRSAKGVPNERVSFKPKWWRYRLERRETCPDTMSRIAGALVREVVGGRCLIEETVDSPDADVVLSIVESSRKDPRRANAELDRIQTGPTTVTITERRDHGAIPVEVKTTLVAHDMTLPFYFTAVRCSGGPLPDYCLVVATDLFSNTLADPFEMIGRRYGFATAQEPWSSHFTVPVADDDRAAVDAILKQDYGADGYIPLTPSRFVASFVDARLKSGEINQDDIELVRTLLKQRAFALAIDSKLPLSAYQALKPLLPEMFERIAYRADGQTDIVLSLNVILDHFSVEDTDPYLEALCRAPKNGDLRVCYKREFRNARKKDAP